MENKCLQCSAKNHCCKNGFAFVGIQDAQTIKQATGKAYADFLDYSQLSEDVLDQLENGDPVLESSLRHTLLKDNKILRLQKKGKNCIFLENGKCSIYKVRPKICQMYPYWCVKLLNGTVKVIDHDDAFCLVRNATTLTGRDETKLRDLFKEILLEANFYRENITGFVRENEL